MTTHSATSYTIHSDNYASLNRAQRSKNIQWHQKHPKNLVAFEPQKCFSPPSGSYTFEHVTHFYCDPNEYETTSFASQTGGINFAQAVLFSLAISAVLPIAGGNFNTSSPQSFTEHDQKLARLPRRIRWRPMPIPFPIRPPRPISIKAPKLHIAKPQLPAKKKTSSSVPKSKDSKRPSGSKTQNHDRSNNFDSRIEKQKRKMIQQQATCAAKIVAATQAANAMKALVVEGKEFIYAIRNDSLMTLSLYSEQLVNLANQTHDLSLNFTKSAEENFFNLQESVDQVWNKTVFSLLEIKNHTSVEIDRARSYILFGAIKKEALFFGLSIFAPLIQITLAQRNNRKIMTLMKEIKLNARTTLKKEKNKEVTPQETSFMLVSSRDSQV